MPRSSMKASDHTGREPDQTTSLVDPARARSRRVWWVVAVVSLGALGAAALIHLGAQRSDANPAQRETPPTVVRVAKARLADLPLVEEYRGELVANVAELSAQGLGRLTEVRAELGDSFERGDVLAVVDAAETRRLLTEAQAQVQAARANETRTQAELDNAIVEAARADQLLAEELVTQQAALALKSRVSVLKAELSTLDAQRQAASARVGLFQEQLSQARLVAPFAGAVAERYLDPGSMVQPGTRVLRLVEAGPLRVRFRVSEHHVGRVDAGVDLELVTLATGERRYPGKVERTSAEVNRVDRTLAVEGVLAEVVPDLRPGMYATVTVRLGDLQKATVIPARALVERISEDGSMSLEVVRVEGGIARVEPVEVLGRSQGDVAVSSLDSGATVVVFGQEALADGDRVRVTGRAEP